MKLARWMRDLSVLTFVVALFLLALALFISTDPDTWPQANPPGDVKTHGVTILLFSMISSLVGVAFAVLAALAHFWSKRREASCSEVNN